jgi:hypothetical protein
MISVVEASQRLKQSDIFLCLVTSELLAFSLPYRGNFAERRRGDTYTGLRINAKFQVLDIFGQIIPGFYCAGESAGGFALHGLGRAMVGGYIAATNAVMEPKHT